MAMRLAGEAPAWSSPRGIGDDLNIRLSVSDGQSGTVEPRRGLDHDTGEGEAGSEEQRPLAG